MGRKGVSKRKPTQDKARPGAGDNSGSIASAMRASANQPVRVSDADKADVSAARGGANSPDSKKKSKKR